MLKPNRPGPFRRSVRNEKDEVVKTLTFERGEPVPVNKEQFEAIQRDINGALVLCHYETRVDDEGKPLKDADGKPIRVLRPDYKESEALFNELRGIETPVSEDADSEE